MQREHEAGQERSSGEPSRWDRLLTSEFVRLLAGAGWDDPSPEALCSAFEAYHGASWSILYSVHPKTEAVELIARTSVPETLEGGWSDLIAQEIARTGLGISLNGTESYMLKKFLPRGGHTVLALPLFAKGIITGAVILGRPGERPYTEHDVDDALPLLPLAALFLANLLFVRSVRDQKNALARDREDLLHVKADLEEDLEQLRNSSRELERSLRELAEKARSRTEFFENISHELRTPLTPIIASSEALLGKTFGELTREQREMVEMLFLSARKLDLLIEDLIELVRLDSGIMKLDMESVDLAAIVDEGIHETALLAKDRHIDLRNELEGDVPFVRGDMKRLSQLLINLLHNAIKFSHEGGVVSVALDSSRVEHGLVGIRVTDRGIGIPAEAIERIFDRFFQAGNGRVGDGLGLGLAIVKKIADAHGGEVRVESEVGEGSSFTVFLPLSREHP